MEQESRLLVKQCIVILQKKNELLNNILTAMLKQKSCFVGTDFKDNTFDRLQNDIDRGLNQLEQLNVEVDHLTNQIQAIHFSQLDQQEEEVKKLRSLNHLVKSKSELISSTQCDIRTKLENFISAKHKEISTYRVKKNAAATYYKTMMKQNATLSYYYDQKK